MHRGGGGGLSCGLRGRLFRRRLRSYIILLDEVFSYYSRDVNVLLCGGIGVY